MGNGKLPLFCGNGEQVIPIYGAGARTGVSDRQGVDASWTLLLRKNIHPRRHQEPKDTESWSSNKGGREGDTRERGAGGQG